jgi:hypothetical protein
MEARRESDLLPERGAESAGESLAIARAVCGSGSGLRIDRGAGFDSIDVLFDRRPVGNERVRTQGTLVDLPFCGKSSVPNRRERDTPAQKLTAAQNSLDVAREQKSERKSPKQTWPKSLRPACYASPFNDKGPINRTCRVSVSPRYHRLLADRALPDGSLADRHLADDRGWFGLIDGLRMRKVGGASDGYEGKRCARYDQSFHHGLFPLGKRKQGSDLLTFPLDIPTPEACTSEYVCSAADGIRGGFGQQCGVWATWAELHPRGDGSASLTPLLR